MIRALAAALGLILMITAAPLAQAATSSRTLCKVSDPRLSEISGMATSRRHADVVWVHNDSGDAARVYGLSTKTCAVVAELNLRGVQARDFEGMAAGVDAKGRSVLWLADIGDNRQNWPEVRIHQVREPKKLGKRTKAALTYRVRYSDGSHDAETILADPRSTQLWLVTKKLAAGAMYRLPKVLKTSGVNVARRIQTEGGLITDGAVAPRGDLYVLRDYLDARIFRGLPPGRVRSTIELPFQVQGEAITWSADGQSLLTISERDDRLLEIRLSSDQLR